MEGFGIYKQRGCDAVDCENKYLPPIPPSHFVTCTKRKRGQSEVLGSEARDRSCQGIFSEEAERAGSKQASRPSRVAAPTHLRDCARGRQDAGWRTHVRPELEVGSATTDVGVMRVVEMTIKNLFGEGQLAVQPAQETSVRRE